MFAPKERIVILKQVTFFATARASNPVDMYALCSKSLEVSRWISDETRITNKLAYYI